MPISELLRDAGARHARRAALACGEHQWTYAELDRLTLTLAAALARRGLRPGDRLAFLLPNSAELVFILLACVRLGAVAVPLNTRLSGPELAYIVGHCGARMGIAASRLFPALAIARNSMPATHWLACGAAADGTDDFAVLLDEPAGEFVAAAVDDDMPAMIIYTSGTTARPKGVTHTQRSLGATAGQYIEASSLAAEDVVLGLLSMSHIFGVSLQLLSPLTAGAKVVVAPRLEPPELLDLIERHRVTHLYGLPVMFDALTQDPAAQPARVASLRYCLAGGDAVTPALSERMQQTLGVPLHEGCGMTEVIPYALNRPSVPNRIGSIGQPSIGMELRVIDGDGAEVATGESGEITVRGPALMAGYWNDADATARAMLDGWFRTGDLGYRDADGYFWFVGRSKDIIVRGGSKVSPLEVEDVLSLHPAVGEVAVVGAPDPALGEIVIAFIAPRADMRVSAPELRVFALERLAEYKTPEHFVFVPALPRGNTGKVQRKTLREWAATGIADSL